LEGCHEISWLKLGAVSLASILLWSGNAFAGSVALTLVRASLINVPDAAGTTQHEAGTISKGNTVVGNYFLSRRVDTLPGFLFNAGATHLTLFFAPKTRGSTLPESVTLDGAHDFSSGSFRGSVSAASNPYSWIRGASAAYSVPALKVETLLIVWAGNDRATLP